MQTVLSLRLRQAVWVVVVFALLSPMPAAAFDLSGRYQVTVPFATPDGKPMTDADVRVFAPGQLDRPVRTGHTDSEGKFEFSADKAGLWIVEARTPREVDRVTVRVGGEDASTTAPLSPFWLVGGLMLLLVIAFGYRVALVRTRRRTGPQSDNLRPPPNNPPA